MDEGICLERKKLEFLRNQADYVINTSRMLTRELKKEIIRIFVDDKEFHSLMVSVVSFGFKYGIPSDADLVFDVRFLPNPYYIDELRHLTGEDQPVFDYVMGCETAKIFADKLEDMIRFLIPNYMNEGKNSLVIGIGCTGGNTAPSLWRGNCFTVWPAMRITACGLNTGICRKTRCERKHRSR